MTEAEMKLQELGRIRRSGSAADRDRLMRMRRRSVVADGDQADETEVEASPGLVNSLIRWWKSKPEDEEEATEARKTVDEALTEKLPSRINATEALQAKRGRMRLLEDNWKKR
jgi:hypothetical protein